MASEYLWAVFALLSAVFFSGLYITDRRFLARQSLNPFVFSSFGTSVGALATASVAFLVLGGIPQISGRVLFFGIVIGLLGSLGSYSYYFALRNNEASHVAPYTKFTSVFSMIFAVLLLDESVRLPTVAGVILVGLGGYIATERDRHGHPLIDKAVVLILCATVFWSIRGIPEKIILSEVHPLALAAVAALTRMAVAITFGAISKPGEWLAFARRLKRSALEMRLLVFRAICSAASLSFYYYALSMAPVSRAIPLANTDPIFTVLLGGLVLGEKKTGKRALGALIAVIGAGMIVAGG